MSEPFTLYDVLLQTLLSCSCGHVVKWHCPDENLYGGVNVNPNAHDFTQLITGVQIQVLMILDGDLDQDQVTNLRPGNDPDPRSKLTA